MTKDEIQKVRLGDTVIYRGQEWKVADWGFRFTTGFPVYFDLERSRPGSTYVFRANPLARSCKPVLPAVSV